jgi:hypothetical protein
MTYVFHLANGGRLEINTEAMSDVLAKEGSRPLTSLAIRGAKIAQGRVRDSGKRFVGYKPAKLFHVQSSDIGRPASGLSSQLRIPVALIFNNSRFALQQEIGSLKADHAPERPLITALNELGRERGVRKVREKSINDAAKFGTASRASRRKRKAR